MEEEHRESVNDFLEELYTYPWLAPREFPPHELVQEPVARHAAALAVIGMGWGYEPPVARPISFAQVPLLRTGKTYSAMRRNYDWWFLGDVERYEVDLAELREAYWTAFHTAQDALLNSRPRVGHFVLTLALHLAGLCAAGHARHLAFLESVRSKASHMHVQISEFFALPHPAYESAMALWRLGLLPVGDHEEGDFLIAVPGRLIAPNIGVRQSPGKMDHLESTN